MNRTNDSNETRNHVARAQELFDSADRLHFEFCTTKDRETLARHERVWAIANAYLAEHGLRREVVSTGNGRFDVRVVGGC